MARSQKTDYLHNFRFWVQVNPSTTASGKIDLNTSKKVPAGFSTCSVPAATVEVSNYKEGGWVYYQKFPGNPSMENITLTRGVTQGDSSFWQWMQVCMEGGDEYRADLTIQHYSRAGNASGGTLTGTIGGNPNATTIELDHPARTYNIHEAFPATHSVSGALDATSNDISIMSIGIAFEYFEVVEYAA